MIGQFANKFVVHGVDGTSIDTRTLLAAKSNDGQIIRLQEEFRFGQGNPVQTSATFSQKSNQRPWFSG
jgi:hypothetical protein